MQHLVISGHLDKSCCLSGRTVLLEDGVINISTKRVAESETSNEVKVSNPRPSALRDRVAENKTIHAELRSGHDSVKASSRDISVGAWVDHGGGELLGDHATLRACRQDDDARLDSHGVDSDVLSEGRKRFNFTFELIDHELGRSDRVGVGENQTVDVLTTSED